jgi:mono/diheme cytochrome c family protein
MMKKTVSNWTMVIAVLGGAMVGCAQGPFGSNWDSSSDTKNSTSGSTATLNSAYEAQAKAIFAQNCAGCHTDTSGPNGAYNFSDTNHLLSSGLIVPGAPAQSPIFNEISSGAMPPTGALSSSDQAIINSWIAGAP